MVEASFNYLARMSDRPEYWLHPPPAGTPWRNTRGDRRTLEVHDARKLDPPASLDREGFAVVPFETRVADLYDGGAVRSRYFREVEALVARVTGASRVLAFDHNVRSAAKAERGEDGAQNPVRFAHNDYTERSAPQRVRDLIGAERGEALLRRRFAVINVWKPIAAPVRDVPLAVCDARTIRPEDLVPTDLRYRDRTGEVYSLAFSPEHRWFYFPEMRPDEALLLKCYDSVRDRARFTAHSAFDDPGAPADAPQRESVEVRTLAFFSGEGA